MAVGSDRLSKWNLVALQYFGIKDDRRNHECVRLRASNWPPKVSSYRHMSPGVSDMSLDTPVAPSSFGPFVSASHPHVLHGKMGGLGSSSGSLFSSQGSAGGGLMHFGSATCRTTEGTRKVASLMPPSSGKLMGSMPLPVGAGGSGHIMKPRPTTGHHEQPGSAPRKRRLHTFSNPGHRRDGDEALGISCGDGGCDLVSSDFLQVLSTRYTGACVRHPPGHLSTYRPCRPTFLLRSARSVVHRCTGMAEVPNLTGCHHFFRGICGDEEPPQLFTDRVQHAFRTRRDEGSVRYVGQKRLRVPHRRVDDE